MLDLALFYTAIDSKLRGCDLVKLKVADVFSAGQVKERASITQSKTRQPVRFEITEGMASRTRPRGCRRCIAPAAPPRSGGGSPCRGSSRGSTGSTGRSWPGHVPARFASSERDIFGG